MDRNDFDLPRWIAWSVASAAALTALHINFHNLPAGVGIPLLLISGLLDVLIWHHRPPGPIAIIFTYFILVSSSVLLPLLFRRIKWKVASAYAALAFLGILSLAGELAFSCLVD